MNVVKDTFTRNINKGLPCKRDIMGRYARKIVEKKTYYYETESDTESDDDSEYDPDRESETEDEDETSESEEISDSEDGSDYESESESESETEDVDDPTPYHGKGFRVYFDSSADKKFFMRSFGFSKA